MTSLIIGGTSLFGRYLAPRLLMAGQTVIVTKQAGQKSESGENLIKYTGQSAGCIWVDMDVTDKDTIAQILQKYHPNVIYDFAVQNSVGYAWKNPAETIDINIIGTLNVFDTIRSMEGYKPRILIAGSGEEYGRTGYSKIPISEKLQPKPNNIFAASKACQSLLANIYFRAYGMDIVTVRTFNECGPGLSDRFSISNFCRQFAQYVKETSAASIKPESTVSGDGGMVLHVGNLNIERDYTDVRDLVNAFISLSNSGKAGEVYNAGRGHAEIIGSVINILEDICGFSVKTVVEPSRIRPIDTPKLEADNRKIKADTGWTAEIELQQTVKDIYEYWLEELL
jgi:GDP-4-dehydro-6-deoxy-D-mannose reductase